METILRHAALWLAKILETYGDPTLQAKLDGYNAKVAAAEAKEKEAEQAAIASEAAYQTSVLKRNELNRLLEANEAEENALEQQLAESQQRIRQIRDEATEAKSDIDALSDHDAVRGNV